MGIFDGCLLACDVDGTLMENGYINPCNIEKIEYFMAQGGAFSISTGRSVGAISSVTDALVRISPSVVANGCMIYDYDKSKILYQKFVPKPDNKFAKFVLDSEISVGIEIHCGNRVFTLKRNHESDAHQRYENLETTVVAFEEICDLDWNKVLFALEDEKDYEVLKQMVSQFPNNSSFISTAAVLEGRKRYYYEQIPVGVSKASALKELCRILNIKDGCFYAIGDYYNDLEMLKNADISAVPNGSPDDIKAIADFISCECKDGAVAKFIDYLTQIHK